MNNFNRNCASPDRAGSPRPPAMRRFRAIVVAIGTFWLSHGGAVFASEHGEPQHEPAKPADAKPPEPPPPPRPTEYPRGLNEAMKPAKSGAAETPAAAPGHGTPDAHAPDPHAAPAAAPGPHAPPPPAAPATDASAPPGMQQMPAEAGKPEPNAATVPHGDDAATKARAWKPQKRYHFILNTYTGLAMGGDDPVQIFVDGRVLPGTPEHELDWGGATWQFANEGNLAAFQHDPEVYAPQFGGRCAFALSQGLLVEAHPQFYALYHQRLYLFANAGNRAAFLTNPDALVAEAERQWPILSRGEP